MGFKLRMKTLPKGVKLLSRSCKVMGVVFLCYYIIGRYHHSNPNRYLEKIRKVGYLKTHKCASTTIQNILLRYAYVHDLNVVLPEKANYLGQGYKFMREQQLGKGFPWGNVNTEYDIFCLHTVWNHEEVKAILGGQAFFFTMLRDPLELFISLWNYYRLDNAYNVTLQGYALMDDKLDRKHWHHIGGNQMLFDFGLESYNIWNESAIIKKIKEIEEDFNLILIQEDFLHSMVLLKNALKWNYKEMSFMPLNSGSRKATSLLTADAIEALKTWLWPDYLLYNYFKVKFDILVEDYGLQEMSAEMEKYNLSRLKCDGQEVKLPNDTCYLQQMPELQFIDLLRVNQAKRLNITRG